MVLQRIEDRSDDKEMDGDREVREMKMSVKWKREQRKYPEMGICGRRGDPREIQGRSIDLGGGWCSGVSAEV